MAAANTDTSPSRSLTRPARWLWWIFLSAWFIAYGWLWYNHAWISEDSLITMRQVGNFVAGNGMVWNLGERVQAFTHPTWFFLLSLGHAISGEFFWMGFALSFIFTTLALMVMARAPQSLPALFTLAVLLFSQSFIDYTSTALENPLSYFLMALVLTRYFGAKYDGWLFLWMALAFLTRMDHALLLLPMALVAWWRTGFAVRVLIPAVAIVLAWFAFSTFYFGHPLPNTFLAKATGTDFPISYNISRFLAYVNFTWLRDPLTLIVIGLAIALPLVTRSRTWVISAALVLYLGYIFRIGADWMGGRFFAMMLFMAVWALMVMFNDRTLPRRAAWGLLLLIPVALVGGVPFQNGPDYDNPTNFDTLEDRFGVSDARDHFNFQDFSLSNAATADWPQFSGGDTPTGEIRVVCGIAGLAGVLNNTDYILDVCALGSAYMARLPAIDHPDHIIGHIGRRVPEGFWGWFNGEREAIGLPATWDTYTADHPDDAELTRYFEDIRLVISGPLFSGERLRAIWRLNLGRYDFDVAPFRFHDAGARFRALEQFDAFRDAQHPAVPTLVLTWPNLPTVFAYDVNFYQQGGTTYAEQRLRADEICDASVCRVSLPINGTPGTYDLWWRPYLTHEWLPEDQWHPSRFEVQPGSLTIATPEQPFAPDDPLPLRFPLTPGGERFTVVIYRPESGTERSEHTAADICTDGQCRLDIASYGEPGQHEVWVMADGGLMAGRWAQAVFTVRAP